MRKELDQRKISILFGSIWVTLRGSKKWIGELVVFGHISTLTAAERLIITFASVIREARGKARDARNCPATKQFAFYAVMI